MTDREKFNNTFNECCLMEYIYFKTLINEELTVCQISSEDTLPHDVKNPIQPKIIKGDI